ncbi:MAG: leucine-rich repeat protein [Prevotellaceae bacterium]|nr:leucine-rich repeat protein [Prevotellaceae bacterium]
MWLQRPSNSVTSIGNYAFSGCKNIEDITFATKKLFAIKSNVFSCQNYAPVREVCADI